MDMIHPLLDKERQLQARRYEKEKRLLGLASMALSLVILLAFYFSGLSAWLANLHIGNSIIWTFLLYVLSFQTILVFLAFPLSPFSNALSRHFERKADRYALESIQDNKAFMTGMAGLADRNLSNAYPEWWVKLLYYSHPPVGERLAMAENYKKEKMAGGI